MYKFIVVFIFLIGGGTLYAKSSDIPQKIRDTYASNIYNAFLLQSQGKSTLATFQFESAREEAKKAGESLLRLAAIEQLFGWYRKYGSALNLFYTDPTGNDRINGEYRPRLYQLNSYYYQSEWGKTPEQAARVRDFMVGVGETISGIFFATVYPGIGTAIAVSLWVDGFGRMYTSLNYLWAGHEALTYLKNCETATSKAMGSE